MAADVLALFDLDHTLMPHDIDEQWVAFLVAEGALGIHDVIATEAEQVDGRYTGRVVGVPNIREGKYERLVTWLASRGEKVADFRECWFYGDSLNDLPSFTRVTHPVVVNADPVLAAHARHMGWPELRDA
jgi:phosphoserine phosphatase